MKKILFIITIYIPLLLMYSCSGNEHEILNNDPNNLLRKGLSISEENISEAKMYKVDGSDRDIYRIDLREPVNNIDYVIFANKFESEDLFALYIQIVDNIKNVYSKNGYEYSIRYNEEKKMEILKMKI